MPYIPGTSLYLARRCDEIGAGDFPLLARSCANQLGKSSWITPRLARGEALTVGKTMDADGDFDELQDSRCLRGDRAIKSVKK
jgi:hypothetical protein